jgi:RimJ/RimL family protein N-acetyltransferase
MIGDYTHNMPILVRELAASDLPILFKQQADTESSVMAAVPSRDRKAFDEHWAKIMMDEDITLRTIVVEGRVAGYLVSFLLLEKRQVGYWLGKEYWGKGIATQALTKFLKIVKTRPLWAHVATHNVASRRVLEKCGFKVVVEGNNVNIADEEVEEFVLRLGTNER